MCEIFVRISFAALRQWNSNNKVLDMMKKIALALVLAGASFAATAGEMSYSYVEGGYARTHIDGLGSGDGFGVDGSVAVHKNIHVFGGYSMQSASEEGIDVDLDHTRLGVGFNTSINDRADFVARAAYERADVDVDVPGFGNIDGKADGWSLEAGFRGQLSVDGDIEGWLMAGYAKLDSAEVENIELDTDGADDDEFYGRAGMLFKFNPTWGVVAEGRFTSDAQEAFVGVRASF